MDVFDKVHENAKSASPAPDVGPELGEDFDWDGNVMGGASPAFEARTAMEWMSV